MKGDERLELAVGAAIALRAVTETFQHRMGLRAFYDGVTCRGVAEADALAALFARGPWSSTHVEPALRIVGLPALLDKAPGERCDVRGVITRVEACRAARSVSDVALRRGADGTRAFGSRTRLATRARPMARRPSGR